MSRKPMKPLLLKIIGFLFVGVGIYGLINIIIGIQTLGVTFAIGLYSFAISAIISIPCLADGFRPDIERKKARKEAQKYNSYVQQEEPELDPQEPIQAEPEEIAQAIKDIVIETLEQNTVETNEGKKPVKYCIDCGCAIDKNSNFCKICGKEQE